MPASELLPTALAGVLVGAGQDHVAYPLQFVDGADERAGIVVGVDLGALRSHRIGDHCMQVDRGRQRLQYDR